MSLTQHPAYERAVDLELVHGRPLQEGERGVARAEVVDGDLHAGAAQLGQDVLDDLELAGGRRLGDLQHEVLGPYPGSGQQRGDVVGQRPVEQRPGREVDRDAHLVAAGAPGRAAREGQLQHAQGERPHQTRLLDDADEVAGRSSPRTGCCQRHSASADTTRPVAQVDLRLDVHDDLVALERLAQLGDQGEPVDAAVVAVGVVAQPRPAGVLRLVHRDVGPPEQLLGGVGVLRVAGQRRCSPRPTAAGRRTPPARRAAAAAGRPAARPPPAPRGRGAARRTRRRRAAPPGSRRRRPPWPAAGRPPPAAAGRRPRGRACR